MKMTELKVKEAFEKVLRKGKNLSPFSEVRYRDSTNS